MLRHDVWATEKLVAYCRTVPPQKLEQTAPGTYGTVRNTLAHIVVADENYLVRLSGALIHDPALRAPEALSLDDIVTHLAHVRDGVERLFARGDLDPDRVIPDTPARRPEQPRIEMEAWVPAAQFVHHGSDHRAQINAILTAHGLESQDVQIWPLAREMGSTRQV